MADEFVELLKQRFFNRTDCVGVMAPWGKPTPVELAEGQLDQLLLGHVYGAEAEPVGVKWSGKAKAALLTGTFRVGSYTPALDGTTRWGCVDFDGINHKSPLADPVGAALKTLAAFESVGMPAYLERSGSGLGYHLWFFFDQPVLAKLAREVARALIPPGIVLASGEPAQPELSKGIEVFPKATKLRGANAKGNMVWLPFWSGGKNGGGRFYQQDALGEPQAYVPEIVGATQGQAERVVASVRDEAPAARGAGVAGRRTGSPEGDAAKRFNDDHPREYPTECSACPICGSPDGFKAMGGEGNRWVCFSSRHAGIGVRGNGCWHGDALDLAALEAGCTRGELLRREGYVAPAVEEGQAGPEAVEEADGEPEWRADGDLRKVVRINTQQHLVNAEAVGALAANPTIFQRARTLVSISHEAKPPRGLKRPAGSPTIMEIPSALLGQELTRVARFEKYSITRAQWEPAHPPEWLVSAVLSWGNWPGIRPLESVIEIPVLRPDGTLLDSPGYDSETGFFLSPSIEGLSIPTKPTLDDAVSARKALLELVADFPWASTADSSAWLAALLTPMCRAAMSAPAPLFLFDANIRGSGKSRLADIIAIICTGRAMPRMAPSKDDEEMRKRITSLVLAGDPLVLLDNVIDPLGGAALDSMLTGDLWSDRVLGGNTRVQLPMAATWYASGNNVQVFGDTARRTLRARLNSAVENPESRTDFKFPKLLDHVRTHRPELIAACLTILRGYVEAGRPSQGLPEFGSYETWGEWVRSALVWCGAPDPVITNKEFAAAADPMTRILPALLDGLEAALADHRQRAGTAKGLSAAQLLALIEARKDEFEGLRSALLELCPQRGSDLPSAKSLGKHLAAQRARPCGHGPNVRALQSTEGHGGVLVWYVGRLDRSGIEPQQVLPVAISRAEIPPAPQASSDIVAVDL